MTGRQRLDENPARRQFDIEIDRIDMRRADRPRYAATARPGDDLCAAAFAIFDRNLRRGNS